MATFANRNINKLNLHSGLVQLSYQIGGIFTGAFLLRNGLDLAQVFLAFGAVLALRFVLRPALLAVSPAIGLTATLAIGTAVIALQYLALAQVRGLDLALAAYIFLSGLGNVFYWTAYHGVFATLGDAHARGRQVAFRQILAAIASIVGPAAGGFMLSLWGPWAAFGAAALVGAVSILPLLDLPNKAVARLAPPGAYAAARKGTVIFLVDGWIISTSNTAWGLIIFLALGQVYDVYGTVLALAALAGAAGGFVLGRFIDAGNGRQASVLFGVVTCLVLAAQAFAGFDALSVIIVAVASAVLGGLYVPAMMTAIYNDAKQAPCPLRYQIAAEGGWDIGGISASLAAAALLWSGLPLQAVVLIAIPAVIAQALLLRARYT